MFSNIFKAVFYPLMRGTRNMANVVTVEYHQESLAVIKMQNEDNRFTIDFFKQYLSALDEIESNGNIKALVTTGEGKFYSNGLDLDNMPSFTAEELSNYFDVYLSTLYKRMLTYPMVTIAAINGHAFAAGGLLALTHDYRVMRKERGWFCLPEVKIKIPFSISLMELAKGRLPPTEYTDGILIGKRYTADEGYRAGIVHTVCPGDEVLSTAIKQGLEAGKENLDREMLSQMKNGLNHSILKAFSQPTAYYSKL